MLKTYRIFPLVFILFLFGFTLITVSPLFAQTVDQLIESIEKLDANDRARVLEYKYSPPKRLSDVTPAAAADGPWDKSMGMRHPNRPCMKNGREKGPRFGCGRDMRSPEQIASDPYDTNNPASLAARANKEEFGVVDIANLTWDESMGMRHPARPCMDKRITAADKQCKKDQKWGAQAVVSGFGRGPMTPSCVNRRNTCGPDRRSAADIASDPYDKKHGPYVQEAYVQEAEVVKPTLSAEEKLHQANVQRIKEESSAARRYACIEISGGYCHPGGGYAQQLVNKGKRHPCHQCGIRSWSVDQVGGIPAFDRVVACQKRTKTPCK